MSPTFFGLLFALIALFAWWFGDFLIQRTTRLVGNWKALFYIAFVGSIGLFPFIKNQLTLLNRADILLLSLIGILAFFGSLLEFEAFKKGKLAVVEPVMALELPLILLLSVLFVREPLSLRNAGIITFILLGILLTTTRQRLTKQPSRFLLEKGTWLAFSGSMSIALAAVLIAISSKTLSPILIIWFTDILVMVLAVLYLLKQGTFKNLASDLHKHPLPILGQSILDNVAWVAFAFSTSLIPISIASAISESYIVLTVLLGIFINKEKLHRHQLLGIILAIIGVIALSTLS